MEPTGPPQPSKAEAYTAGPNPTTRNPAEHHAAEASPHGTAQTSANTRGPSHGGGFQHAEPSPLAQGIGAHGPADAGEARAATRLEQQQGLQNENEDADKMAPPSEGAVADAVERKSGGQLARGQGGLDMGEDAADLNRKKAEQASAREAIRSQRRAGLDVDDGAPSKQSGVAED